MQKENQVEKELVELETPQIITKVENWEWGTPTVPKGEVWICGNLESDTE